MIGLAPILGTAFLIILLDSFRKSYRAVTGLLAFVLFTRAGLERELPFSEAALQTLEFSLVLGLTTVGLLRVILRSAPVVTFAIFVGIGIVSGALSAAPSEFATIGLQFYVGYLMLFVVGWRCGDAKWMARTLVIASGPSIALGLRQAFSGHTASEIAAQTSADASFLVGEELRLIGGFGTGQEFGLAVALVVALAAALSIDETKASRRIAWGAVATGASFVEILALQRVGLLFIAGSLISIAVARPEARRQMLLWSAAGALVVAALVGTVGLLASDRTATGVARLESLFSFQEDASYQARLTEVWPAAIDRVVDAPVVGLGPGTAGSPSFEEDAGFPGEPLITDNILLGVAAQTGVLGLLSFVIFVAALWRSALDRTYGRAVLSGLAAAGTVGAILGLIGVVGLCTLAIGASLSIENASLRSSEGRLSSDRHDAQTREQLGPQSRNDRVEDAHFPG